jgi:hypothetical protein
VRRFFAVLASAVLIAGVAVTQLSFTAPAKAALRHTAVQETSQQIKRTAGDALSVFKAIPREEPLPAPKTYDVRPGDSLSVIAGRAYGNSGDWPVIYWANRDIVKWADELDPGWKLTLPPLPANIPAAPKQLTPSIAHTVELTAYSRPQEQTTPTAYSTGGMGSFQSCVISRESGGNSQVMNSSGHYGLYQFDYGTWVSGGGNPDDFGHASISEQNAVFAAVYAARGVEPWAPSDGC